MAVGHLEDPDFDPGFPLDLTADQEHLLTLAVFADDVEAPMRSLVAMVADSGEITTLYILDVPADHPRQTWPAQQGHHDDTAQRRAGRQRKLEGRK
jgi:hypothetical protein